MKKIYKFGIIALLQLPMVNFAQAEQLVIVSPQADGKVVVLRSGVEQSNWKVFPSIKVAPPKGATAVIFEAGKPPRWSKTPLTELYRNLGGTGNLEQEIFNTGKMPKNIEISKGSKEIELPEATDKTISLGLDGFLPEDGIWDVQLNNVSANGCPPIISTVLAAQSKGVKTRELNFTLPFHPSQLFVGPTPLKWQDIGLNSWRSILADYGPNTKVKSKGMSFKVVWDVNVKSPTKIFLKANIDVKLSPILAAAFGGSNHCEVNISGHYTSVWN